MMNGLIVDPDDPLVGLPTLTRLTELMVCVCRYGPDGSSLD